MDKVANRARLYIWVQMVCIAICPAETTQKRVQPHGINSLNCDSPHVRWGRVWGIDYFFLK